MFAHEVKHRAAFLTVGGHDVDVFLGRDHLGADGMVIADADLAIHQAEVVRRDPEGNAVGDGLLDGGLLLHCHLDQLQQRGGIANDVL